MRRVVLGACLLLARPVWGQTGTIVGTVMDSVHGRPLIGAAVLVDGSTLQATTDSTGHFRIDAVPAGSQRVTVHHPLLDSLEVGLGSIAFTVPANAAIRIVLATPSAATALAAMCADEGASTLVLGRVSRGESDEPVHGAGVRASWNESTAQVQMTEGVTDRTGHYHLCVPPGPAILLHAQLQTEAAGYIPAATGTRAVVFSDIRLPTIGDTTDATLSGKVVNETGVPVRGASITFLGRTATATTGSDGQFHMKALPGGTQIIIVRSVGLDASILPVDLTTRAAPAITVTMHKAPPTLATVNIVADRELANTYDRLGFSQRKRVGNGTFLTQEDILKKAGVTTGDALVGITRMTVGDNGDHGIFGPDVDATYHPGRVCTFYVVDRQVLGQEDFARGLPPPTEVIGIEVYKPNQPPAIPAPPWADGCAEVVVWTKAMLTTK